MVFFTLFTLRLRGRRGAGTMDKLTSLSLFLVSLLRLWLFTLRCLTFITFAVLLVWSEETLKSRSVKTYALIFRNLFPPLLTDIPLEFLLVYLSQLNSASPLVIIFLGRVCMPEYQRDNTLGFFSFWVCWMVLLAIVHWNEDWTRFPVIVVQRIWIRATKLRCVPRIIWVLMTSHMLSTLKSSFSIIEIIPEFLVQSVTTFPSFSNFCELLYHCNPFKSNS